jgi:hypothetical protein
MKEKMNRKRSLINFFIVLLISLSAVFFTHLVIKKTIDELLFSNLIIESYLLNFCLGYFSFVVLIFSMKKYVSSLGYILIYISFLKFLIFYFLFKPYYNINQSIELDEFLTLMVPYGVTLAAEIYSLSKVLKT